jgi:hypothetical protein
VRVHWITSLPPAKSQQNRSAPTKVHLLCTCNGRVRRIIADIHRHSCSTRHYDHNCEYHCWLAIRVLRPTNPSSSRTNSACKQREDRREPRNRPSSERLVRILSHFTRSAQSNSVWFITRQTPSSVVSHLAISHPTLKLLYSLPAP